MILTIITMMALTVWVITVEVRLTRLYAYNEFLEDRVIDVDARMRIAEGREK